MIDSRLGQELFDSLPEVYRTRDNAERVDGAIVKDGDLARYLDACGQLLDLVAGTLEQRLKDTTPEQCQPWLLPYFAALVGARLRLPDAEGRRGEVANAIPWRQAKGTLACVAGIARAVGRTDMVLQEGWKRVLVTARIGEPVCPAQAYDSEIAAVPLRTPGADVNRLLAATHPGLPMGTVDFRRPSRAVQALPGNPAAASLTAPQETSSSTAGNRSLTGCPPGPALDALGSRDIQGVVGAVVSERALTAGGGEVYWRTANPHGAPCAPGGFDDRSARTVDVRSPAWNAGHFHPKRLLLFVPPPPALFYAGQPEVAWAEAADAGSASRVRVEHGVVAGGRFYRDADSAQADGVEETPVPALRYLGLTDRPVRITGPVTYPPGPAAKKLSVLWLENLAFPDPVGIGIRLVARRSAFVALSVHSTDLEIPAADLADTLAGTLTVGKGLARLSGCTVLTKMMAWRVQATDCIFPNDMAVAGAGFALPSCVRFSRLPAALSLPFVAGDVNARPLGPSLARFRVTAVPPLFQDASAAGPLPGVALPNFGVLHLVASQSIATGAEDGGEMGAYHAANHRGRITALIAKLAEFLPVGIDVAVVNDRRMDLLPPKEQ